MSMERRNLADYFPSTVNYNLEWNSLKTFNISVTENGEMIIAMSSTYLM